MRTTEQTLAWYRSVDPKNPPFKLAGMCLKICRSARAIPARYPTALSAMLATPREDRVYDPYKIVRGMVMYFDDPADSNTAGHIVTVAGRQDDRMILTWTNDAEYSGSLNVVRASFFPRYWGDTFQFAATSLNGFDLDLPEIGQKAKQKKPLGKKGKQRIKDMIDELEGMIERHEKQGHDRIVKALRRDVKELKQTLERMK